jgi:hypothetical protein
MNGAAGASARTLNLTSHDAIGRCEAMHAFTDSAQAAVNAGDDAKLDHAIQAMAMTLLDLEQYRDRERFLAEIVSEEEGE